MQTKQFYNKIQWEKSIQRKMIKEYLTHTQKKPDEKPLKTYNICVRARNEHICNESSERSVIEREEGGNKNAQKWYALTWVLYTQSEQLLTLLTLIHTDRSNIIITDTVYPNRAAASWALYAHQCKVYVSVSRPNGNPSIAERTRR